MSTTSKKTQLPIYVVEDHNDVVPHIHRAIASHQLPFRNIPIIHLDSHPDLLLPIDLDADSVFQPHQLYESISIENWLLPLVYAKHIHHVVWVKPPWANQIEASEHSFLVGKNSQTGKIRVSSKENYFITEGLFCDPKDQTNGSEMKLTVVKLLPEKWSEVDSGYIDQMPDATRHKSNTELNFNKPNSWADYCSEIVQDTKYILDIDLDFFSVTNPFDDMFTPEEKETIRQLYRYPALKTATNEEISEFTKNRQNQLTRLENIFSNLDTAWSDNEESLEEDKVASLSLTELTKLEEEELDILHSEEKSAILFLCQSVLTKWKDRDVNFIQLHDFGCTLDDTELPHHISSDAQIQALGKTLKLVMEKLPRPTIVTMARSSLDDYCPKDQVERIEIMMLKMLQERFGEIDVVRDYESI